MHPASHWAQLDRLRRREVRFLDARPTLVLPLSRARHTCGLYVRRTAPTRGHAPTWRARPAPRAAIVHILTEPIGKPGADTEQLTNVEQGGVPRLGPDSRVEA